MLKILLSKNNSEKNELLLAFFFSLPSASHTFATKGFCILTTDFTFFPTKDTEMLSAKTSRCFSVFILLRLSSVCDC